MVRAVLSVALAIAASSAAAQDADALRQQARRALGEGRFEQALTLFQHAAEQTDDASVLVEIGETADRLRRDEDALHAYETYLQRRPDAPNRNDVAARVRVLREAIASRCTATGGRPVESVLVDWNGGHVIMRRRPMGLAEWSGAVDAVEPAAAPTPGLGRQLSPP